MLIPGIVSGMRGHAMTGSAAHDPPEHCSEDRERSGDVEGDANQGMLLPADNSIAGWRWAPAALIERLNLRLRALTHADVRQARLMAQRQGFRLLHQTATRLTLYRPAPDRPRWRELLLADAHDPAQPCFVGDGHGDTLDAVLRQATRRQLHLPAPHARGVRTVSIWATRCGWWGLSDDGEQVGPLEDRHAVLRRLLQSS